MPHCIIEHSNEIDGSALIPLVHKGALESGLFQAEGSEVKVRAMSYSNYQNGSVDINFIHVTLKILSGRDTETKLNLSSLVLKQLQSHVQSNCSISVEVVDIDRDSYSKAIV